MLQVQIKSHSGEVFTIYGEGQGDRGVFLLEDPVGLMDAPLTTSWQQSTCGIGARMTGVTYEPRDVHLPLGVVCPSSPEAWRAVDSFARKAFSVEKESQIIVNSEDGTRYLNVRLFDAPQMDIKRDPGRAGYAATIVNLRAGNPMWQGERQVIEWDFTGKNFYDHITVSNPGDRPLWPQWILPAPSSMVLPDYDFENNKEQWVRMPFQAIGQDVLVDTRPDREEAVCAGHPMWLATLPDHFVNPIPPHTKDFKLPVVVNPYPFADAVMQASGLPTRIPTSFIVASAKTLVGDFSQFDIETMRQWSNEDLASRIYSAAETAAKALGELGAAVIATITSGALSLLLKGTFTVADKFFDQKAALVVQPEYSRPWGL